MVVAVGRNPDRREENNDQDGMTVHNNFYSAEMPMGDNIEAAAQEDDPDAAAQAAEDAAIHALQNAPMQPEPHMGGGAPTAPMMAPEEEAGSVGVSESLGELDPQNVLTHGLAGSDGSADAPVDDDLSEAAAVDGVGAA